MEIALYLTLGALVPLAWILVLTPSTSSMPPLSDLSTLATERSARNGARNRIVGWALLPFGNAGLALALIAAAKSGGADGSIWIAVALAIQILLMLISASRTSPFEQVREHLSAREDFVQKTTSGADMADSIFLTREELVELTDRKHRAAGTKY